jgi:hypothetical protein
MPGRLVEKVAYIESLERKKISAKRGHIKKEGSTVKCLKTGSPHPRKTKNALHRLSVQKSFFQTSYSLSTESSSIRGQPSNHNHWNLNRENESIESAKTVKLKRFNSKVE